MSENRRRHWDGVYASRRFTDLSWYQDLPAKSLALIAATGIDKDRAIIDVGGGASTLVDHLLDRGYRDVSVLDLSATALDQARARLGARAAAIRWLVADVTRFSPERAFDLWHDRAVLHFLVDSAERHRYVAVLRRALVPGGHLVLATFGPDGPLQCSGLAVRRYSVELMAELLGPDFALHSDELELHETPSGGLQQFLFTRWQRKST